jgi:hypothetical protein
MRASEGANLFHYHQPAAIWRDSCTMIISAHNVALGREIFDLA